MFRVMLASLVFLLPLQGKPPLPDITGKVVAVQDGDTITVLTKDKVEVKVGKLKGDRPANAGLYKVLHWLETARRARGEVSAIIDQAQTAAGYGGTRAAIADKLAITWNRDGLLSAEGLAAVGSAARSSR